MTTFLQYFLTSAILSFLLVPFAALAQSSSVVEVITNIHSSSSESFTQTSVETHGDAEVHIRTTVNGRIIEDVFIEGDNAVYDRTNVIAPAIVETGAEDSAPAQSGEERLPKGEVQNEKVAEGGEEPFFELFLSHVQDLFSAHSGDLGADVRAVGENVLDSIISVIRETIMGLFNQPI